MRSLPVHLHDVAILLRDPGSGDLSRIGVGLEVQSLDDEGAIQTAHDSVGHRIPELRMQRRLRNGLRFLRFDVGGVPVATTWAAGTGRYIDEISWLLPIGPGEWWVRDLFIAPGWRGKGLFNDIAAALSRLSDGTARRVWSDVDLVNVQSMRSHEKAGFRVIARVRALDLNGRFRVRSALPPWPLPVTEIDPASRWIWLRGQRLHRHQELLA